MSARSAVRLAAAALAGAIAAFALIGCSISVGACRIAATVTRSPLRCAFSR